MRTAIVPAQITTVEDKVAGNLSLAQLLLLCTPIFVVGAIYAALPPFFGGADYKTIFVVLSTVALWILAVRFKGRILLEWAITVSRYNLRPRHYVFDKNDDFLRPQVSTDIEEYTEELLPETDQSRIVLPVLSTHETVLLEGIMANPEANFRFTQNRKGALDVRINEVG